MLVFGLLLLGNDSPDDLRDALDDDVGQFRFELLHHEVHLLSRNVERLNVKLVVRLKTDMLLLHLQLRGLED